MNFIKSFLTDNAVASHTSAFIIVVVNSWATISLVMHNNAIPANILALGEASTLILLAVLSPAKVIEMITSWKSKI